MRLLLSETLRWIWRRRSQDDASRHKRRLSVSLAW